MCGLFGMIDCNSQLSKRQKSSLLHALATAAEQRGTDASGISYFSHSQLHIIKKPVPGRRLKMFIPENTKAIIGHTRMTTQGDAKFNRNNHPFEGYADGKLFSLAHNGVLYNDDTLRNKHSLPKTAIETDSYVAVQLIEKENSLSFDSLKTMAEEVRGSFTFTVLDDGGVWFVKGDSPLCLRYFPSAGVYLYASTEPIMDNALAHIGFSLGKHEDVAVDRGEIVRVDASGNIERSTFTATSSTYGSFGLYDYGLWDDYDATYLDDLRYMAGFFGYNPKVVDRLLAKGFTTDEIEDALYGTGTKETVLCDS